MMLLACNLGQHFQDLNHTFSPIGSPGRKSIITHISFSSVSVRKSGTHYTCKLSDPLPASLWFPDLRRTLRCSTHNCSVVVSVKGTSRRHTYIFSGHWAKKPANLIHLSCTWSYNGPLQGGGGYLSLVRVCRYIYNWEQH